MPSDFTIRVRQNNVAANLALLSPNIDEAMTRGVVEAGERTKQAIVRGLRAASTPTGRRRKRGLPSLYPERPAWREGRGPGREESGALIASVDSLWTSKPGRVTASVGYQANHPRYAGLQEFGSPGQGGVPAAHALVAGETRLMAIFEPLMNKYCDSAVRAAELGRRLRLVI